MAQRDLRAQTGRHAGSAFCGDGVCRGGTVKSSDRVIGRSGDQETNLTAEARRRGGERRQNLTTETTTPPSQKRARWGSRARRQGEESGHREIGTSGNQKTSDRPITCDPPIHRLGYAWSVLQATI